MLNEELIPSSINQYMVGFAHSLHIQSDLNPKIKLYPLDGMRTVYVRLRFLLKLAPQAGFSTFLCVENENLTRSRSRTGEK